MFSINKTTHPATAVEHVLSCNFFNQSGKSLVVAGANNIRVFQLIPDVDLSRKNYHYSGKNSVVKNKFIKCSARFDIEIL